MKLVVRGVVRLVVVGAVLAGLLFGSAGTVDWPRGWSLLALLLLMFVGNLVLMLSSNPELAAQRWSQPEGTEAFDRVFGLAYLLLVPLVFVLGGLGVRFGWPELPIWVGGVGLVLHVLGMIPVVAALRTNQHLETTVRIQEDHHVITTGPYRVVRHPMYVGMILLFLAWPLVLGATASLLPAVGVCLLLVWRTGQEDRVLRQKLEGYEAYAAKTRYRLLPGVW